MIFNFGLLKQDLKIKKLDNHFYDGNIIVLNDSGEAFRNCRD